MTMHSRDAANHARRIVKAIDARDDAEANIRAAVTAVSRAPSDTKENREILRDAAKDWHAADDQLQRIRTGARP